jgi:hypothetical protein
MALKEVMQDINIKRRREFMSTTMGPYDRHPLTTDFALDYPPYLTGPLVCLP